MKKYITKQTIATLARIAVLGAFSLLVPGFSPTIAAALSRNVDVGITLPTMRLMIGLLAIRDWLPPFGRARFCGFLLSLLLSAYSSAAASR